MYSHTSKPVLVQVYSPCFAVCIPVVGNTTTITTHRH